MNILIVHGQNHEGSTCMVARKLANKVKDKSKQSVSINEIFLPKDFNEPCLGCGTCFLQDITKCSHFTKLEPLSDAILKADLLILDSPVYVLHATGQMMSFLDHFGTWWINHRARKEMTYKQGVAISTAAGAGMKSTCKDMADSLQMWGIRKVYKLGFSVYATKPCEIPKNKIDNIEKKTDKLAKKLVAGVGKRGMNKRAKRYFYLMRFAHKHLFKMEPDYSYWEKNGWLKKSRPWRDKTNE